MQQIVELRLRSDVDPAGDVREQQNLDLVGEALADQHLLLVASAKRAHLSFEAVRTNAEPIGDAAREIVLRAGRKPAPCALDAVECSERDVLPDRMVEEEPLRATILRDVRDTCLDRGAR